MATRNRKKTPSDFDLDSYLDEKANESDAFQSHETPPVNEKKSGSFFRNLFLVLGVSVLGVLWYYDWSPREAISGIFGSSEPEVVFVDSPSGLETIVIAPPNTNSGEILIVDGETVSQLEQSAFELATSEEFERLTEESVALALEAAFNALEGLQGLESLEGLEGLESLESLEGLEGLEELEGFEMAINEAALEALSNLDFSGFEFQLENLNAQSFDLYYGEIGELGITKFSGEEIRSLYDAGVPSSFLSKLQTAGLLDRLDSNEIIEIFKDE